MAAPGSQRPQPAQDQPAVHRVRAALARHRHRPPAHRGRALADAPAHHHRHRGYRHPVRDQAGRRDREQIPQEAPPGGL